MSVHPDHSNHVRRVVLPSGKTIEVVLAEDGSAPFERPTRASVAVLHMCGQCGSNLVYPLEWEEADSSRWQVTLRCPNCECVEEGVYEQDAVDALDEELDRGSAALARDAERLAHGNMADAIERFVAALNADHIVPADF